MHGHKELCSGTRDLRLTDNTNADIDTRAHWIKLAASLNIPIRCVLFTSPAKLCEHNDTVRALGGIEVSNRDALRSRRRYLDALCNEYPFC